MGPNERSAQRWLSADRCLRFHKALELPAPSRMSEFPQRLGLDLSDPLAGDVELLAHFLQGMIASISKPETELQNLLLPFRQCPKHLLGLTAQVHADDGLDRGDRSFILDEVTEMRSFLLPDGCFQRDRFLSDLQDFSDLSNRQVDLLGDLLRGGLPAIFLNQVPGGASQLVDGLDHMNGDPDGASLIGNGSRDGLADPPGGIRAELISSLVFKFIHRPHQADVPFLDQVKKLEPPIGVFLRDADYKTEVGLHHLLLRQVRLSLTVGDGMKTGS